MKKTLLALIIALPLTSWASLASFYPANFENDLKNGVFAASDFKKKLLPIVRKNHVALGYEKARIELFGHLDLKKDSRGFYLEDVYCHQEFTGKNIGPKKIPDNKVVNCEHTWPQSKFNPSEDVTAQKSDIHHLYVTGSKVNSTRGNFPFGELLHGEYPVENCQVSLIGQMTDKVSNASIRAFEPPTEHRGNVARSLFYFSTRYNLKIDPTQEEILKKWNNDDPVDQEEIQRNNRIEEVQGNRNPFIDFPELAEQISDF